MVPKGGDGAVTDEDRVMSEVRAVRLVGVLGVLAALLMCGAGSLYASESSPRAGHPTREPIPAVPPAGFRLPTPQPGGGMGLADRLAPPPLSDPPTQIELGHWHYNFSCMVCHGDRGQGLTPEWRTALDPADRNCWQARCHGPSHPPYGFEIPKTAPMIIGAGALSGYRTTADLFNYLRAKMPWSYPGLFEDTVYWELTAYLSDVNKVDLGDAPLGPDRAEQILVMPELAQTHHSDIRVELIIAGVTSGLLLAAAVLRVFFERA